ncbi:hypothetical protein P5V15_001099 [Pogonomyrmex californicus]
MNERDCIFRIDMGSNVTIFNKRYVVEKEKKLKHKDFLKVLKLENIFKLVFSFPESSKELISKCCRVESTLEYSGCIEGKVPEILKELFAKNSSNLNDNQKETFADFLIEFQDIFSESIVAKNCDLVEHKIKLKN